MTIKTVGEEISENNLHYYQIYIILRIVHNDVKIEGAEMNNKGR